MRYLVVNIHNEYSRVIEAAKYEFDEQSAAHRFTAADGTLVARLLNVTVEPASEGEPQS